eukprot:TRINITY_DN508_c0_g1_i1.p1 TRINITY_DN508_c0_g1~~TRINITY_DN508_c0_g1_i1.p1  ORF type:complete len:762 (+),score=107.77 TRINITY_DN508_c0_g1_i1:289-2286(+)
MSAAGTGCNPYQAAAAAASQPQSMSSSSSHPAAGSGGNPYGMARFVEDSREPPSFAPSISGQVSNGDQTFSSGQPLRDDPHCHSRQPFNSGQPGQPFQSDQQLRSGQSFGGGQPAPSRQSFNSTFQSEQPFNSGQPPNGGQLSSPNRQQFNSGQPSDAGQPFQREQTFSSGQPFHGGQPPQHFNGQHFNGNQPINPGQSSSAGEPMGRLYPPDVSAPMNSIQQPQPCAASTQFGGAPQAPGANMWPTVQHASFPNHVPGNVTTWGMGACSPGQGGPGFGDQAAPAASPPCTCGLPSNPLTVRKEGPNMGRMFFKCSKPQGEQCNYFQWADEPIQAMGQGGSDPPGVPGPPCQCGLPSVQLTVRKEGPNTGRLFFGCGRQQGERCNYFQWADEPPPQPGAGGNGVGGQAATGPPCTCGTPSIQLTVRKEGPNTGRMFYKCSKPQGQGQCNYFQWADEPIQAAGPGSNGGGPPAVAGPPCQCGQPSVQLTVRKEGPNTGRMFYGCARQQGERCNYFQWADEPVRGGPQGGNFAPQGGMPAQQGGNFGGPAAAAGPPCICGQPSTQLTVRKEGPNTGRQFYKCSKPQGQGCDYFQWADEPIATPARAGDNGFKGKGRGRAGGGRGRGRGKKKGEPADDFGGAFGGDGFGAAFGDDGFGGFGGDRFQPF